MPKTTKITAATARTNARGSFFAATSPSSTAGAFASIIPNVVPAVTSARWEYFAARATVAICVLSPISRRKNAAAVVPNTPQPCGQLLVSQVGLVCHGHLTVPDALGPGWGVFLVYRAHW